jgi:rfaE bifunctional protein nucleotidyltransferase chain/domain
MSSLQKIKNKIFALEDLKDLRKVWKKEGKKVVFTNGCFDLIHLGHIDYLSKASDLGDRFIIAVNSDRSVSKLKGAGRPIKDELTRTMLLASFNFVDAIFIFNEDTPQKVISELLPDVLVKGGDYDIKEIVGYNEVTKNGGKVVTIPFVEGYSTTNYEQKIIDNYLRNN